MKRVAVNVGFVVIIIAAVAGMVLVWPAPEQAIVPRSPRDLARLLLPESVAPADLPDELNILVVGTDRRRNWETFHCDGIHMIHFDLAQETAEIVNVPRGTLSPIPMPEGWVPKEWSAPTGAVQVVTREVKEEAIAEEEDAAAVSTAYVLQDEPLSPEQSATLAELENAEIVYETSSQRSARLLRAAWSREQYLANVCEFLGVDEFQSRVERITGYEADYRVLVGFSQAQSILQVLKFDPVTTLQFLRHRQSYAIGDPQRSYNQAVFLRDLLTQRLNIASDVPVTAQFALYQLVDTDMPLPVAKALLERLQASAINGDATRVTHRTEPPWVPRAQEIHFDPEQGEEQVQELYARLARLKPGFSVEDIQPALRAYHQEYLLLSYGALVEGDADAALEAVEHVLELQSWQQLEDDQYRYQVMVEAAALQATISLLTEGDVESALTWPRIMRGLLEAESAPDAVFERLDAFLEVLVESRP